MKGDPKWLENQRKRADAEVDVDWLAYFKSIQKVCPWSMSAALQGRIRIETWHSHILDLGDDHAIVYVAPHHKPRQLKKITDGLNEQHEDLEFLWSHPRYKGNSTPTPVIIQQHRSRLESIRKNLKNNDLYK